MKIKVGDYLEITQFSNYCRLNAGERLIVTRVCAGRVYWNYPVAPWIKDWIGQEGAIRMFKHIPAKKQMENK